MLRQKIQISTADADANIKINLKSEYMLGGLTEDIDNLVTEQTVENINNGVDAEKLRFTPLGMSNFMSAKFYSTGSSTYVTSVAPNEFTASTSTAFLNSLYVYKIFDSTIENEQNLLHTGYLNGFNFNGLSSAAYKWNGNYEYGDIHIPNFFIESITGTTFKAYMKMNFYSAKSGIVYPFSRVIPTGNTLNESDLYQELTFTGSTKKYVFTGTTFTFYEITNPAYVEIINDSVDSISVEKPTYPSGNTFTIDGEYVTVD